MRFDLIEEYACSRGWPPYRLNQLRDFVFKKGISSWEEATSLPKDLREQLKKNFRVLSFSTEKVLVSGDSRAAKALLKLDGDGAKIETVLIRPLPGHWSVCVSTQAGCPVGCPFCATGNRGFTRNLTAEEIWDQVLFWCQYLKKEKIPERISSVVYMGMGEPFLNYEAVARSIKVLTHPDLVGLGQRHISVSTAGHIPGIARFAGDFPQVNLAVSLHSADDRLRERLVPFNRTFPLQKLKTALDEYIKKTNRKVFIEYSLISGVNDSDKDASKLAEWINSMSGRRLVHVNLIRCNETGGRYLPGTEAGVRAFLNKLTRLKISATARKSLGHDIQGACGQLAGK